MDAFNDKGTIRNKDGRRFDRSTGTWENQNVEENPSVVKEDASNSNSQDTTTNKNSDTTTQNSNSTETQQTDAENKNPSATNEKSTAETPKPPAETPKPPDETPKPTAETPKPLTIDFYIDGKQVHFPFDDLSHFNELRAQLASGTTLNDDLITKMKPIFAEARL